MKRFLPFILALITTLGSVSVLSQNTLIQELMVLDSNNTGFRFNRQSLITDNSGNLHLFYVTHSAITNDDYIIKRTSYDSGNSWELADTISIHHPTATDYGRFYALAPMAIIDDEGNIKVMYEYRGEPIYLPSYSGYPPSHINFVQKVDGEWTTEVDVINDHAIQSAQGNSSTVCYLMDNQFVNYNGYQYYTSYDYAWWATKYNIVYSDNTSGNWETASPLYTFDLGSIDTRILRASSLIVNNDSLFSIWYQSNDCQVEMKAFDGNQWSDMSIIYNDVYIPETGNNHYNVAVGSFSNGYESRISMMRTPEPGFHEVVLLSKSANQAWTADTLMLEDAYSSSSPMVVGDTTYLFLINNSTYNYSYILKYLPAQGVVSKSMISSNTLDEKFSRIIMPDKSVNPLAYMVYDENTEKYYLKIGKIDGITAVQEMELKENNIILSQNFPNPFKNNTTISYTLSENSHIKLCVYDIMGRLVNTVVDEYKPAGNYSVNINCNDYKRGIYLYTLSSDLNTATKQMFVMH